MKTLVAPIALALVLSACGSREQYAERMSQRYDIPMEAALYVEDRCPLDQFSLVASVNGCRRRAARAWNEEHPPDRQISVALDMDSGGGAAFLFVPVR